MIVLLPNLPAHVVGIAASGQVDATDYQTVIAPAIESALKTNGRISLLYHLGPTFTGFTSAAIWEDMKVGMAHLRSWDRIAVVSDKDWISNAISLFGFAIPCPVRVFSNQDFSKAQDWISAS
jgi:hypothetical protein